MFLFSFNKLLCEKKDWTVIVNDHSIGCCKKNAEKISKKIFNWNSQNDLKENKPQEFFTITIPELNNSLICSESDYQYFDNIFNLVPVQITVMNKETLKIFADKLEIKELSNIIKMFESSYDIISNDENIQIQQEITNSIIDISEDNFESLMDRLIQINNEHVKEDSNDFFYNIFLTTCLIRTEKIELILNFLKEFEKRTNGSQFKYFKDTILLELNDDSNSNEIFYIVRHLYDIHEIDEQTIKSKFNDLKPANPFFRQRNLTKYEFILFDKFDFVKEFTKDNEKKCFYQHNFSNQKILKKLNNYSKEELIEYAKNGYEPTKIYQAIKNDDIDLFSQIVNAKSGENKFNDELITFIYERNKNLVCDYMNILKYIDFACFYGSEKIFNYILMNCNDQSKILDDSNAILIFSSGNISMIHKFIEGNKMYDYLLYQCILTTIQYHHNDVFEWLIETYDPFKKILYARINGGLEFLKRAIQYNNIEALNYLFSIGIDYTPLFSLSMLYNNYYLSNLALKLQYKCNESSPNVIMEYFSPYFYVYENVCFKINMFTICEPLKIDGFIQNSTF